jgi:hypothetical protein
MNAARYLGWELRLQLRYGMGYAAAFVALTWSLLLWAIPAHMHELIVPIALEFDAAIFGFYLMTGLMFLEKSDRTLSALSVTPLGGSRYLAAKVATITTQALVASIVIVLVAYDGAVSWAPLILGVCLQSAMTMLAGFATAARFRSINEYFLPSSVVLLITQLPLLDYFGIWSSPLLYVVPTQAPLVLLKGALTGLQPWQLAYGIGYGLVGCAATFHWANRTFKRFIAGGADERVHKKDVHRSSLRGRGLWALAAADVRNMRRDPFQMFILFYAVVIALVGRWLLPWAVRAAADWVELEPHLPLIISWMALQAVPIILGVVVGLLLLDERDERWLIVLRVSPMSLSKYVLFRTAVPVLLSAIVCVFSVHFIGLWIPDTVPLLAVSLLAGIEAPLIALTMATFANNKVEGLALMKGMSLFMYAPVVAWFLSPPWRFLPGIVPTFWPAEAFWRAGGIGGDPWWVIVAGFAVHIALLWWLARRFARRVAA